MASRRANCSSKTARRSPPSWLAERLARAHRILVDRRFGHLNIAQIAHESGFGDVSYFNRAFRRHFGSRPSDFREAAKFVWREQRE